MCWSPEIVCLDSEIALRLKIGFFTSIIIDEKIFSIKPTIRFTLIIIKKD